MIKLSVEYIITEKKEIKEDIWSQNNLCISILLIKELEQNVFIRIVQCSNGQFPLHQLYLKFGM